MAHRIGQNRRQFGLFATPLDELIAQDNMVRVIDAFVDAIDLDKLGFTHVKVHKRGVPPYHPALLLKIYSCGYLNRARNHYRLGIVAYAGRCQPPAKHSS
jgi:transposase